MSCNGLPGFSVDVHEPNYATTDAQWLVVDGSNGNIGLKNVLSGTYLSVCNGCNGLPGYSVDVHNSGMTGYDTNWVVESANYNGIVFKNIFTGTYLTVCDRCKGLPGYSVDVHEPSTTANAGGDAIWIPTIISTASNCSLDCTAMQNQVKTYYDTLGEWKGVYTMAPNKVNKVNDTQCDVLYTYTAVPFGGGGPTGQDKRRFTFLNNGDNVNCNWGVQTMGAYQSGSTL
jgi:hypothetical protein